MEICGGGVLKVPPREIWKKELLNYTTTLHLLIVLHDNVLARVLAGYALTA